MALLLVLLGVAIHAALSRRVQAPERFFWLLVAGGVACLLAPELVYVRDEFDNSDLFRMNTVFKLGYQAFVLLAIAAACALPWAGRWLPRRAWTGWAAIGTVLLLLGLVFPYAGNWARRDGFSHSPTLDGLGWLRASAPGDVEAIDWLRENAPGDAVLLEAAGPDYSGFGHGRMSTFTGRPAVIGWAGHEQQWKHDPGTRADDVRAMYTATRPPKPGRGSRSTACATSSSARSSAPTTATPGSPSGTASGRKVFDRNGAAIWDLRLELPAAGDQARRT